MTKTYLWMALLSILPISELRGAIPYGYFNDIPLYQCFFISVLANVLVAPIGFFFLNTLHRILDKWGFYHRIFEKTVARARSKVEEKISKYGLLGLMFFVAIPLPITGAWTGTLGAWVLGLDRKKSILSIACGVLIAGIIVTAVVYTGAGIGKLFTKQINI